MIRIATLLAQYRSLVLIILFLPALGFFLSSGFRLEMIPENPHLQFKVIFDVPAREAEEIARKVTEPAEKIFNGLSGLLGSESITVNEKATVLLKFSRNTTESKVYLDIQEKMDRVKLMLPRDVDSYAVERVTNPKPADLAVTLSQPTSIAAIRTALGQSLAKLEKSNPTLDEDIHVQIIPHPQKLNREQVAVSEFVNALTALGFSTALGRKDGVMFETGSRFQNIEDLKSALIGARGQKPIRLSDVAEVNYIGPKAVTTINLWVDKSRISTSEIKSLLKKQFPDVQFSSPFWQLLIAQSLQPILLIVICFLMQLFVVFVLKLPAKSMFFMGISGLVVAVHFLFWKGLIFPPLTVLDLHALALTLFIGSILLAVLILRIRTFFLPEKYLKKPPKTLDQAKLFSLSELLPTFIAVCIAYWLISLPAMSTAVNLPSKNVLESMFYFGLPILFLTLVIIPLSTSGAFLTAQPESPQVTMHWNISPRISRMAVWTLLFFTGISFIIFWRFNFGVNSNYVDQNQTMQLMTELRGYAPSLIYKTNITDKDEIERQGFTYLLRNEIQPAKVYEFSASGIRFASQLDLAGFANSLKDLQRKKTFGFLQVSGQDIPIQFSAAQIGDFDIPNILLAKKSQTDISKPINTLVNSSMEFIPTQILRDNLLEGDRILQVTQARTTTFKLVNNANIWPSPWAEYLLKQYSEYVNFHLISLIFIFFTFAIYLNSFIRSGLVLIFALSTAGFVLLCRYLFPGVYHADSIWILHLASFMALFQILTLTRIIDIERSRGYDRDDCIQEIKEEFAPGVYLCSWTFVVTILIAGLTEQIDSIPSLGLWHEGVFIAALTGIILVVSNQILFPLFYLTSEEVVNGLALRLYRILTAWKR